MTTGISVLTQSECEAIGGFPDAGFGSVETAGGQLPLKAMEVSTTITGLLARTTVRQTYVNVFRQPLEATYIFPLPDRYGVDGFRFFIAGRRIEGCLRERKVARAEYDAALQNGQRAAISEQERPDVFTVRAGNIGAGESMEVEFSLSGPVSYADGEVTFRFPLVVAPRYIPGTPLGGPDAGTGVSPDTDRVPDASRITPPVLLKGFPNPIQLAMNVEIDPGGFPVSDFKCSLHHVDVMQAENGHYRCRMLPGTGQLNRDFILRFRIGRGALQSSLLLHRTAGESEGTFALVVVPPDLKAAQVRPRDIVVLLDRSGSMGGWKIAAARRAAARFIDSLTAHDRFGIMLFDDRLEHFLPAGGASLVWANDRNRFRGVEFLAGVEARGGTEIAAPLTQSVKLLASPGPERDPVVVLITDGQVGNEDELLWIVRQQLANVRVFTIGIDSAVNASFLRRLAEPTGGTCELVESESRLDDCMRAAFRRIGRPVLTQVDVSGGGLTFSTAGRTPEGAVDVFPGTPAILMGRFTGELTGPVTITGSGANGENFNETMKPKETGDSALATSWARSRLLDLEYHYASSGQRDPALARTITTFSLATNVLCRFTAFVAVDPVAPAATTGPLHRVTQPVEETMDCLYSMASPPSPAPSVAPAMASARRSISASSMAPRLSPPMSADSTLGEFLRSLLPDGFLPGGPTGKDRLEKSNSKATNDPARPTRPADPLAAFRGKYANAIRALVQTAIARVRAAKDTPSLARELSYLLYDLRDLLRRVREEGGTVAAAQLEALVQKLEAVPGDVRVPGNPTLAQACQDLVQFLAPSTTPGTPAPGAQRDFWM